MLCGGHRVVLNSLFTISSNQSSFFQYFYHHRNALDVGAVIREAYRLMECTPDDIDPKSNMKSFTPLPISETYPIFNKYPKFIVDYQAQEKERIRQDELDYLKERWVILQQWYNTKS